MLANLFLAFRLYPLQMLNMQTEICMQRRRPPRPVTVRVTIIESTYSDAATELTEGVVVVHSNSEEDELEEARPTRHVYASLSSNW